MHYQVFSKLHKLKNLKHGSLSCRIFIYTGNVTFTYKTSRNEIVCMTKIAASNILLLLKNLLRRYNFIIVYILRIKYYL